MQYLIVYNTLLLQMSAKSIEDLKKIANSLREKLNFLNKNIQNTQKDVDPKAEANF